MERASRKLHVRGIAEREGRDTTEAMVSVDKDAWRARRDVRGRRVGAMRKWGLWLVSPLVLWLLLIQFGAMAADEQSMPKKLNPYTGQEEAIKQGRALYLQHGCSGCHGVGGGGGMGPALLDDEWTFGSDDETLLHLIKGEIPQQTMPAVFGTALPDDDIWKILAYVRSLYRGNPSKINW
jgi:cytochrome c(L)